MDPLSPQNLFASWLFGLAALPVAVVTAVAGQGLGALAGGCSWIGLTLPIHRQPWALVNEPALNFASTPAALGYWLGALLLPAALAVAAVHLVPRSKSVWAELAAIQISFGMAAGCLGWIPLLDPTDGHLARWLDLQDLPPSLVFLPPLVGAVAVLPAIIRLLAFNRAAHRAPGTLRRTAVALLHFAPPAALWIGLGFAACGHLPLQSAGGVVLPLLTAVLFSAVFSVEPWVLPLEPGGRGTVLLFLVTAVTLGSLLWFGGRPLPQKRAAGILWARPAAYNNVRPWIVPVELFDGESGPTAEVAIRNHFR